MMTRRPHQLGWMEAMMRHEGYEDALKRTQRRQQMQQQQQQRQGRNHSSLTHSQPAAKQQCTQNTDEQAKLVV